MELDNMTFNQNWCYDYEKEDGVDLVTRKYDTSSLYSHSLNIYFKMDEI